MWELSKSFRFEAAHTLDRRIQTEASRRIHGHSYRVVATLRGTADPASGMVTDLAALERQLAAVRSDLDHRLLDEVPDLGPPTLENLGSWLWARLAPSLPGLARVTVHRDSLDESCSYTGPQA